MMDPADLVFRTVTVMAAAPGSNSLSCHFTVPGKHQRCYLPRASPSKDCCYHSLYPAS